MFYFQYKIKYITTLEDFSNESTSSCNWQVLTFDRLFRWKQIIFFQQTRSFNRLFQVKLSKPDKRSSELWLCIPFETFARCVRTNSRRVFLPEIWIRCPWWSSSEFRAANWSTPKHKMKRFNLGLKVLTKVYCHIFIHKRVFCLCEVFCSKIKIFQELNQCQQEKIVKYQ